MIKYYEGDDERLGKPPPLQLMVPVEEIYEVEKILEKRVEGG